MDQDKQKVSIVVTSSGREHTFTVTDDTTLVGPRGGKVRGRLSDPRFHEGMELTVVAEGNTATEIHLGYSRKEPTDVSTEKSTAKSTTPGEERAKAPAVAAKAKARPRPRPRRKTTTAMTTKSPAK